MIARLWHGRVPLAQADAYAAFLEARAMPDYRSVPGNLGAYALRRDEGGTAHFMTLSWWDSEAAIRAFAGDDLLKAKYYPEDAGCSNSSRRWCTTRWRRGPEPVSRSTPSPRPGCAPSRR